MRGTPAAGNTGKAILRAVAIKSALVISFPLSQTVGAVNSTGRRVPFTPKEIVAIEDIRVPAGCLHSCRRYRRENRPRNSTCCCDMSGATAQLSQAIADLIGLAFMLRAYVDGGDRELAHHRSTHDWVAT